MRVIIDACVLVSAYLASDSHHSISVALLREIRRSKIAIDGPVLLLVEVAAAMARNTQDARSGHIAQRMIEDLPLIRFHPLSLTLAKRAAELASQHFLRGADAVYVAVADATQGTLITLDYEMKARGSAAVPAVTPGEWLEKT